MGEFETVHTDTGHPSENTSFTIYSVARLERRDLMLGGAGLIFWVLLFTAGCLIASEPYRKKLGGPDPLPLLLVVQYCIVVLASYTVTNVAMLCCISSLLGGIYRGATKREEEYRDKAIGMRILPYLIQGFVIFLLLVSGLFLLGEEPFNNLTQNKYIRLAGTASLLSFLAGYRPRIFYKWLERLDESAGKPRTNTPLK